MTCWFPSASAGPEDLGQVFCCCLFLFLSRAHYENSLSLKLGINCNNPCHAWLLWLSKNMVNLCFSMKRPKSLWVCDFKANSQIHSGIGNSSVRALDITDIIKIIFQPHRLPLRGLVGRDLLGLGWLSINPEVTNWPLCLWFWKEPRLSA